MTSSLLWRWLSSLLRNSYSLSLSDWKKNYWKFSIGWRLFPFFFPSMLRIYSNIVHSYIRVFYAAHSIASLYSLCVLFFLVFLLPSYRLFGAECVLRLCWEEAFRCVPSASHFLWTSHLAFDFYRLEYGFLFRPPAFLSFVRLSFGVRATSRYSAAAAMKRREKWAKSRTSVCVMLLGGEKERLCAVGQNFRFIYDHAHFRFVALPSLDSAEWLRGMASSHFFVVFHFFPLYVEASRGGEKFTSAQSREREIFLIYTAFSR